MTLGLIARCNGTGLSTMTWELWRHLQPARTLVVYASDRPRAAAHPEWYEGGPGEVRLTRQGVTAQDARWLLQDIDTLYSAETWYGQQARAQAAHRGVRTVLHAMPEYYDARTCRASELWAPTRWEQPPRSQVVSVPVATDRFRPRLVEQVRTLYHIASPTPLGGPGGDRNGTAALLEALPLMRERCELLIRGHHEPRSERIGPVDVWWLPHHSGPYYEAWPDEADALVMPRRYAGLSLPMQEAAAQGLPIIASERQPEMGWLPPEALVPTRGAERRHIWRQCCADVHELDPGYLAARLDWLVADPGLGAMLSEASRRWAAELAWSRHLEGYRAALSA